jgi:tRNA A-37 threonylcarbamoyl transferase component Bud32
MLDDSLKDGLRPSAPLPTRSAAPPAPNGSAPPSGGSLRPVDALVGKVLLDRVRILRTIARGGMGRVYVGEQTRLKRRCAVKVLDPRLSGGGDANDYVRRFLLEASVAAKLTHPNVVTIFDYGETPDGCFIAMEYLSGRSLADELGKIRRLSPDRAIHVAIQVCRALREAHELGVVHRDIKPGNIFLLKQDDDDDFVKVLDFGLVHDSRSGDVHDQGPTDRIMGSPRYMAPEQVQGKDVDGRADVYSLGTVLYLMLTGHAPFERRTELATMMAQVSDAPPPMQTVAPDLALPPGLEAIVMRCLAKNPDGRWASMEELAQALQGRSAPLFMGTDSGQGPVPSFVAPRIPTSHGAMAPPEAGPKPWIRPAAVAAVLGAALALAVVRIVQNPAAAAASTVAAPPAATQYRPPQVSATLHVESDPPGAKVNEEGETMCPSTPCDIVYVGDGASPNAEHLLAFLLPGYKLERKVGKIAGPPVSAKLTKAR